MSGLNLCDAVSWISFEDDSCNDAVAQGNQCHIADEALLAGVHENVFLKSLIISDDKFPMYVVNELELLVTANENG